MSFFLITLIALYEQIFPVSFLLTMLALYEHIFNKILPCPPYFVNTYKNHENSDPYSDTFTCIVVYMPNFTPCGNMRLFAIFVRFILPRVVTAAEGGKNLYSFP